MAVAPQLDRHRDRRSGVLTQLPGGAGPDDCLPPLSGHNCSGLLRSDALNKPTRKMREEPVALGFNGQNLAVQFPQPSEASLWHSSALALKLPKAGR